MPCLYNKEEKKVQHIGVCKGEFPEGALNDHMQSVQEQANGYIVTIGKGQFGLFRSTATRDKLS